MNGDVPATASTGFGFHLIGERPVVDAKIVRGLGLRQNPVAVSLPMLFITFFCGKSAKEKKI